MATSRPNIVTKIEKQALITDFAGQSVKKYLIDYSEETNGPWDVMNHFFHFVPHASATAGLEIHFMPASDVPADANDFDLVADNDLWLPGQPFVMDHTDKTGGLIADASPTGTGIAGDPLLLDDGASGAFPGGLQVGDVIVLDLAGTPEFRVVIAFDAGASPDEAILDQAIGTHADNDTVDIWQGLVVQRLVKGVTAEQVLVINKDGDSARNAQAFKYNVCGQAGHNTA